MSNKWDNEDELPTSRGRKARADSDHTLGQLMVESLNHRRRLEVLEALVFSKKGEGDSLPPTSKHRYFQLARKAFLYTLLTLAGLISAIKELGFLKP